MRIPPLGIDGQRSISQQKGRETGYAACRKIDKQGWQPVKISSVMCSGLRTNNGAQSNHTLRNAAWP